MFSKACEYGIKSVIYITSQSIKNERVKIGDVAKNIDSPIAFTAKIIGALTKHDIVKSFTGPYGGYEVDATKMKTLKLSDIVFAIDGDSLYTVCGLGLKQCSNEHPCPIHYKFLKVRNELKKTLETTTIHDLALSAESGKTILK